MAKISLEKQLQDILSDYNDELHDTINKAIDKAGAKTKTYAKTVSEPHRRSAKSYVDGWTVDKTQQDWQAKSITIWNQSKPGLVHLLSDGHAKRTGGRVQGDHHADRIDEYGAELVGQMIEEAIKEAS